MIEAIIFDFDGVILDSMGIKSDAFAMIYNQFGQEIAKKAVDFHQNNGGMSRYEKFRFLHKNLLNVEISDTEVKKIDKVFSAFVMDKITEAPFIKGVYDFISNNFEMYKMFISSGTPLYELKKVVELKSIGKFFKSIYGSPQTKPQHIGDILNKYNIFPSNAVFIGDGIKDKEAAEITNIHFIAKIGTNSMLNNEKYQINDFSEIDKLINKINLTDLIC